MRIRVLGFSMPECLKHFYQKIMDGFPVEDPTVAGWTMTDQTLIETIIFVQLDVW